MRGSAVVCTLAVSAMLLSGCSTRPRNFAASVSEPVADRTSFEKDYRTCQALVRAGRSNNFKAAAATALATGAGTVGSGMAMAGAGMVGITSSGGAVVAVAAMPVVGVLAGFGVSRMIRTGKERKFKRAMTACLSEYGYAVEGWTKLHKRDDAANIAARTVPVTTPPAIEPASAARLEH